MSSSGYAQLEARSNRGWPWPEDSFGLTPMFGAEGWCRTCGVPQRAQSGSLVLQRKGFNGFVEGGWIPNWQFDVLCLERGLAQALASEFNLQLLDVDWHPFPAGLASQIAIPVVGQSWFDHDELRAKTLARHGRPGRTCRACGTWRWMPLGFKSTLPPYRIDPGLDDAPVAASPEWFGDGLKGYREILVSVDLARRIAAASPRRFKVVPVEVH